MKNIKIDLLSDTVTLPTKKMREAMEMMFIKRILQ